MPSTKPFSEDMAEFVYSINGKAASLIFPLFLLELKLFIYIIISTIHKPRRIWNSWPIIIFNNINGEAETVKWNR